MRQPVTSVKVGIAGLLILVAGAATAGFAGSDVFLPMVGRQAGVYPSNWYTTVWVHNPGTATATARIYFLERNTANLSPPWVDVAVGPGATEKLENVVETYFHLQAFGALRVTCGTQRLVVTSRVYSSATGAGETDSVGQDFAGVPAAFAIGLGERTQVLGVHQTVPAGGSECRFNYGFVETTGQQANVRVRVLDDDGTELGSEVLNVREYSQRQVAFKDHFPAVSTRNARLEVQVESGEGRVIAYGSSIANGTQDPTTLEMTYADAAPAAAAVQHDVTLVGDGTAAAPLGIADGAVALRHVSAIGSGADKVLGNNGSQLRWQDDGLSLPFERSVDLQQTAFAVTNTSRTAISGASATGVGVSGSGGNGPLVQLLNPVGVLGRAADGSGVLGVSSSGSGVRGSSMSAAGVSGESLNGYGIRGMTSSAYPGSLPAARAAVAGASGGDVGILGVSQTAQGVRGDSHDAPGVEGTSLGAPGVKGYSLNLSGVYGVSQNSYGVSGTGWVGVQGTSTGGAAGYFEAGGTSGVGVYACGSADGVPDIELGARNGDDGLIYSARNSPNSDIGLQSMDRVWIDLDDDNNSTGSFFQVRSGANAEIFRVEEEGAVRIPSLGTGSTKTVYATSNGYLTTTSPASDARLKTEVVPLAAEIDVLSGLARLTGVRFHWDTSVPRARDLGPQREVGLIAQDVETVLPELVSYDEEGYRSLDYVHLTAFLVEVAKAQQQQIDEQREVIRELGARLAAVEAVLPAPTGR